MTLARAAGEEDHRLARRIAAADQRDVLAGAEIALERRGPIMDRRPFEFLEPVDVEPAVTRAGRDHDGARLDALAGGQS